METINGLLKALDNKVPASIAKRLDGLQKLNQKLVSAKAEHNENPTEESQESLDEIIEFIQDTQDDLESDLEVLVEQKRNANSKLQAEARSRAEAKSKAEARSRAEAKEKEELEKKQLEEKALESSTKIETEKKSGIGWGGLLLGGALLVLTGGAIKFFGNKK